MDLLCRFRPKPALPFAAGYKVIDFSLSNCVYSGIDNIAVLIDYRRLFMANYLRNWHAHNASSTGLTILKPRSGSYKGTADAVYRNLDYLRQCREDRVLILAGDHVYRFDYRKMLAAHEQNRADVTIGIVQVPVEECYRFGTVSLNGSNRVKAFLEKSQNSQSNMASMGIYIFNKDILIKRLIEDAVATGSRHDFGYSIIPKMVQQDRVFAYYFNGYWQDIGTMVSYYKANMELLREAPKFGMNGTAPILTEELNDYPPRIFSGAVVKNSLLGGGCNIKGYVENSVLFPGVTVDERAVIRNSIIMEGSTIGYRSIINRCILDEGVNISHLCYIGFGSSLFIDNDGLTILGKQVEVPPLTAIGQDCKILPNVKARDFPSALIPCGSVITPYVAGDIPVING